MITSAMHVLLIAPSSPPKNSPEAMQVGRFLSTLDSKVLVTLVTTPVVAGWQWEDCSLTVDRPGMNIIELSLPAHRLTQRILANRRLSFLHNPDSDFWISWLAGYVLRRLSDMPDVIYSRSAPFSAALLALRLKTLTGKPWLMHLSDPWSGSPYRKLRNGRAVLDRSLEQACFAGADMVTFTTEGQADFYRERYPDGAGSIFVTPNMMPSIKELVPAPCKSGPLRLVYTGALYGDRDPESLLSAIGSINKTDPHEQLSILLDFYGNMSPEMAKRIDKTLGCSVKGPIPFADVLGVQAQADILVTVEPAGNNPLLLHFLLSKIVDYIATGKPILAITPKGSETDRLCSSGYGWSFSPDDSTGIEEKLSQLVVDYRSGKVPNRSRNLNVSSYLSRTVTDDITHKLADLASSGSGNDVENIRVRN